MQNPRRCARAGRLHEFEGVSHFRISPGREWETTSPQPGSLVLRAGFDGELV